jgi:hypothetical protein
MWKRLQRWMRRQQFREGMTLSRFIAPDVRREVVITSIGRLDEGIITARVRTTNLLYVAKHLMAAPEFEAEKEIEIDKLWHWTGKSWGGLADGTSLVNDGR